ncbi:vWA domain-containing protein [Marinisporobacter balticus]|uniref:von Willebrand factor type A domain-containing protein n=1 Tax=Marinisporobacter balticus TaxID=2018667 RepID=A0A4R2KN52_9FIRM|nr:vWA domain-containing protein [Marinisporobacter balticus]TCO71498.1 von Willebrand factor type A domain-containing protein [Marinisporobacter balticus]
MNKFCKCICLIICFMVSTTNISLAEEIIYKPKNVDIMFVIDSSYSMNINDKNKIATNMMKMFIDTLPSKNINVGYVAYNDSVTNFLEPMPIETYNQRSTMKNRIESIRKAGYSDMGLGLKKGFELITAHLKNDTQPIMILISDGETSLSRNSNRTINHSNLDINDVIHQSNQINMPIYTIALEDESERTDILTDISKKTGAKTYIAPTSNDLIEIFTGILKTHLISTTKPIVETIGTGKKQEITIPIFDSLITESNILLISSSPIKDYKILNAQDSVSFAKSEYYFSAKIVNPLQQEVKLEFIGDKNDTIKGYLLSNYDISLNLDVPDVIYKNRPFTIDASFINNTNNEFIKDTTFYNKITPVITLINNDNKISLPINRLNDKIQINNTIGNSGKYILDTNFKHENFNIKFNELTFDVRNNPPSSEFFETIKLPIMSKNKVYQLDQYFHDPDGDILTYEIINTDTDKSNLNIKNSELIINHSKQGAYEFTIKASDNEGLSFTTKPIMLSIIPKLQYYYRIAVMITCLLIGSILFFSIYRKMKAPKRTFTGKINGYFINLKDKEEVPPLTISLYKFENKKRISLEEMIVCARVDKPFLNASQIYFEPGFDKSIVFYNSSAATAMINSEIACKNVKYTLRYKTKIYITFEDGISEIELHYNKANPTT